MPTVNRIRIGQRVYLVESRVRIKEAVLRRACDEAEPLTAKSYWPYPTYADLLFGVK